MRSKGQGPGRLGIAVGILASYLALMAFFPYLAALLVQSSSTYMGTETQHWEVGQSYQIVEHPPQDPNGTWGPTTKEYIPNTYVFMPNGLKVGAGNILAGGIYQFDIVLNNDDPRGLDHTFTLAYPDGSPLYTLWLNRTGTSNTTADLRLDIGNGFIQVSGGPPLNVLVGSLKGTTPKLTLAFYCLHHRALGMTGQFSVVPDREVELPRPDVHPSSFASPLGTEAVWAIVATVAGVATATVILRLRQRARRGR